MSDNVVTLHPKDELSYWVCGCGCRTHFVRNDGEIECASCGEIATDAGEWKRPPSKPGVDHGDDDFDVKEFSDGQYSFPCRRFADRVSSGEFQMVVGIKSNGGVSTIRDAGTKMEGRDQRRWLIRRLREAYRFFVDSPT